MRLRYVAGAALELNVDLLFFWSKKTYKIFPLNILFSIYIGANPGLVKHEFIHAISYAKQVVVNDMKTYFT